MWVIWRNLSCNQQLFFLNHQGRFNKREILIARLRDGFSHFPLRSRDARTWLAGVSGYFLIWVCDATHCLCAPNASCCPAGLRLSPHASTAQIVVSKSSRPFTDISASVQILCTVHFILYHLTSPYPGFHSFNCTDITTD